MNSLFSRLPANIYVFVYADDILLVVIASSPGLARRKIQGAVNAVAKWTESVGFTLSAVKSVRGHVCRYKHQLGSPAISINGDRIPNKKIVRVLGVSIDRNLKFREHFNSVKASCKTRVNLIKTISKPHRSNNRDLRLRVAKALIDSRLFYGLELTCISRELLCDILESTHNGYIRTISGLLPSTPAFSACAEIGTLPFRMLLFKTLCQKAATIAAKTSGSERTFLLEECDRILRITTKANLPPVAKVHWNGPISWQNPVIHVENSIKNSFRKGSESAALQSAVRELVGSRYPYHNVRYTDGSLSSRGVGIGVFGPELDVSQSLAPECSVFSAEAAAIFTAITTPSSKPILVLTDSASVLAALGSDKPKHPWIQGIIAAIQTDTTLAWIPGHCKIAGNEAADRLAGVGHEGQRFTSTVPLDDVKKWILRAVWNHWAALWNQSRNQQLRKIKDTVSKWTDLQSLRDQKKISRLRTGHARFAYNFGHGPFRINCDICGVQNSVEHVICNCPQYNYPRETYGISTSIRNALGDDAATIGALLVFLKEAGLYHQI
ncbi:uncharacterized protein LOC134290739 [Aedes albopictus]|uniref:RNase H type-1 domain-containing protein n=1 Tax=Aedes albopictus TaxID=7160 RepID=A0ABM1ZT07_AEDAL